MITIEIVDVGVTVEARLDGSSLMVVRDSGCPVEELLAGLTELQDRLAHAVLGAVPGCSHDAAWARRSRDDSIAAAMLNLERANRLRAMSYELGTWGVEAGMAQVRSALEREARAWEQGAQDLESWARDCDAWAKAHERAS